MLGVLARMMYRWHSRANYMDGICAWNDSHNLLMTRGRIQNPEGCALEWLKDSAKLVAHVLGTGRAYALDGTGPLFSEERLMDFSEDRARMIESLNGRTATIWHIQTVEPV